MRRSTPCCAWWYWRRLQRRSTTPWWSALPALDVQDLQAVQKLGQYPKEVKNPSSDEDKRETKLAHLIRKAWYKLQEGTQSQLNGNRDQDGEYPWISKTHEMEISICPHVPDDLLPRAHCVLYQLWVLAMGRSVDYLKEHFTGTKLRKDAGIVQKVAIPASCR